ncbi:MAG: hypothetical protein ACKO40_05885 [Planctomycetaceae bacterium]
MPRPHPDAEKLIQIAALCREAIQAQRDREHRQGYGLDDYSEGRIVGGANLARKILRAVIGNEPEVATPKTMRRASLAG